MNFLYTFFITFILIFISELGDKTQLLVLSFVNKLKASRILLGVAIGTLCSHGFAIIFGSHLGLIDGTLRYYLSILTYISFIMFGIFGFFRKKSPTSSKVSTSLKKDSNIYYIFLIALAIFIGELGDKTFLASLGLGIEYPYSKISLIIGSVSGMVASNSIAILFGKFLNSKVNSKYIQILSNILFILFGVLGFLKIS